MSLPSPALSPRAAKDPRSPSAGERSLRTARAREVVGRLRVRCLGASHLTPGDIRLFQWGTPDPYAVLYLRDQLNRQHSPVRRTCCIKRTRDPQWREEFWFAVRKSPEQLVLHVDIYDYDCGPKDSGMGASGRQERWECRSCGLWLPSESFYRRLLGLSTGGLRGIQSMREDDFLGQADLLLDWALLQEAARQRQVRELPLQADPSRGPSQASGSVKLEVSWEPSLRVGDGNLLATARAIAWVLLRSAHALRVLRIGLLGAAGLLLIVAQSAPWLCRGTSLADCATVDAPSSRMCGLLAAMASLTAATVHFVGSSGLLGAAWRYEPLSLMDLAEEDFDDGEQPVEGSNRPTIQMTVQPAGVLGWSASLSSALLPKVSLPAIYLFTFYLHLAATGLSMLALLLAWLRDEQGFFMAEGPYLDLGALLLLVGGAATSQRERRLWAEMAAERDGWQSNGGPAARVGPRQTGHHVCTGGSGESPVHLLEDLSRVAERSVMQLKPMAEELARPLLDARDRLQERLDRVQVAQPFVEVRQRLQEHLDSMRRTEAPPTQREAPSTPKEEDVAAGLEPNAPSVRAPRIATKGRPDSNSVAIDSVPEDGALLVAGMSPNRPKVLNCCRCGF